MFVKPLPWGSPLPLRFLGIGVMGDWGRLTRPKLYLHEKHLTPIQINEEERSFVMSHQLEKHIVKRYSQAFKQKVVCEIEAGQLSVGQAQ